MQRLEVSGAVRPLYGLIGVKGLKVNELLTLKLGLTTNRRSVQIPEGRR